MKHTRDIHSVHMCIRLTQSQMNHSHNIYKHSHKTKLVGSIGDIIEDIFY